MVLHHKQRLTVLLLLAFTSYLVMYLFNCCSLDPANLITLDLFTVSTGTFGLGIILDKTSLSFCMVVTFISMCVFMFARFYMSADEHYYRFGWILLSFVLSMNLLIVAGSFILLMVGWDGLGVSSFALIIYYQSKESAVSGFLTLLINRLGDVVIMGLLFFMAMSGFSLVIYYPGDYYFVMLWLLCVGALTKSAQYPFSVWLPAAMAAPTPVSALVHSSTLVTAGVYIIIRATTTMQLPVEVMSVLMFCGATTSLLGGCCAMVENDLKKIIAYSTLSQLGVMMFSLGMGSSSLALLHLYSHAMFKALLFLVAGAILMLSFGVQDIRLLGAVTRKSPTLLVLMNVSAFCLMGLPFLSAFYSKHAILGVMWTSLPNSFALVMMLISTGLTGAYMIRLLKCMNWTTQHCTLLQVNYSGWFYMPLYFLFVGSLLTGMFFYYFDLGLPSNSYSPLYNDAILYLMTSMGLLFGCLYINRVKVSPLINMFYLVPLWHSSALACYHFTTNLVNLDQGWLEPQVASSTVRRISATISGLSGWPSNNFTLLPHTLMFVGFSLLTWICLK